MSTQFVRMKGKLFELKKELIASATQQFGNLARLFEDDKYYEEPEIMFDKVELLSQNDKWGFKKSQIDRRRKRIDRMLADRPRLFAMIYAQLDEGLLSQILNTVEDWEKIFDSKDPLLLWRAIKVAAQLNVPSKPLVADNIAEFHEVMDDEELLVSMEEKVSKLRKDIIGSYKKFVTPYGEKALIYCDWTASGRGLKSIEHFMNQKVLPFYGNTHTNTSQTGSKSTAFRREARELLGEMVNAQPEKDVVLFCGNGTTASINKMVSILGFHALHSMKQEQEGFGRPVVFTSMYEHHSNLLPWREAGCEVIMISAHPVTGIDLEELRSALKAHTNAKVKVGSFSASSNVTGMLTDVYAVAKLLHEHQALACFDYATAGPYVPIDMNPTNDPLTYKDAVYFSGHKFLGGPSCTGVLIVKKSLMSTDMNVPPASGVGGGTVFYVTKDFHMYLPHAEDREEGGTPNIVGDIKMGLICRMKKTFPAEWTEHRELEITKYALHRFGVDNRVEILGYTDPEKIRKLPIFSFLIHCADRFLHYNFVTALLNDLFGVQSRGGCMCAGPFGHELLGVDSESSFETIKVMHTKQELYKPGFTRLSFTYWSSKEEVDYVIDAILFIAEHGWKFLPQYWMNVETGDYVHVSKKGFTEHPLYTATTDTNQSNTASLTTFALFDCDEDTSFDAATVLATDWNEHSSLADVLDVMQQNALKELQRAEAMYTVCLPYLSLLTSGPLSNEAERIRWFVLMDDWKATHEPMVYDPSLPIAGVVQPHLFAMSKEKRILAQQQVKRMSTLLTTPVRKLTQGLTVQTKFGRVSPTSITSPLTLPSNTATPSTPMKNKDSSSMHIQPRTGHEYVTPGYVHIFDVSDSSHSTNATTASSTTYNNNNTTGNTKHRVLSPFAITSPSSSYQKK